MSKVDVAKLRTAFPNSKVSHPVATLEILNASNFEGVITAAEAQILMQELQVTLDQLMVGLTSLAAMYAVVPISDFRVGAIACGLTGNLYYGANMEFQGQALSFSTHAEQAATVNAWTHGEQGLTSIAVNAAPCGYCRQFLYETTTASKLNVILSQQQMQLTSLLPLAFGPRDLGVDAALLSPQNHGLTLLEPDQDPAVQQALAAANASYAPYTSTFAGVGIALRDGSVCGAPYAENAAYNPSMSPMEAALAVMNLRGYAYDAITSLALVEVSGAVASQIDASRAVTKSIGKTLKVAPARAPA